MADIEKDPENEMKLEADLNRGENNSDVSAEASADAGVEVSEKSSSSRKGRGKKRASAVAKGALEPRAESETVAQTNVQDLARAAMAAFEDLESPVEISSASAESEMVLTTEGEASADAEVGMELVSTSDVESGVEGEAEAEQVASLGEPDSEASGGTQVEWRMKTAEFTEDPAGVEAEEALFEPADKGAIELAEGDAEAEAEAFEALEHEIGTAEEDSSEEGSGEDGLSADEEAIADEELGPAEFIEADHVQSIIESLLFTSERPVSLATIKQIFKGSNVRVKDIKRTLDILASEYARAERGVTLEEINGGYQLRTKVDNADFIRRLNKARPFRLSGPSLEVLSILAYKQPVTKHEVDEIRGVESGHLIRALMERGLVSFGGKAENLPGKPMQYGTTKRFLETFGLRNIKELPTLAEIDELLPEGIGEEVEEKKPVLADITDSMSEEISGSYSEGEEELGKITDTLKQIDTSSEFFEQEKIRQREKRDSDRATDIREAMAVGENVDDKDIKWLKRYEARLAEAAAAAEAGLAGGSPAGEGAEGSSGEMSAGEIAEGASSDADDGEFRKDLEDLTEGLGADGVEANDEEAELLAETGDDGIMNDSDWDDLGDGSLDDDDESERI